MKKTLKNLDVLALPAEKTLDLTVEAGAEVWVQEEEGNLREREILMTLKQGARVHWITRSEAHAEAKAKALIKKKFILEEGAELDYFHHVFGNCEDSTEVVLKGGESRVHSQTLFFGQDSEKQNLTVNHVHQGKNTRSKMISRGAVKDSAYSHFFGNITMQPGCSGADGSLEEHNLLLSSGSKIEAVPALEVHHDEVQASHSATLERIDDEKLFYLQSRGLSSREAMELLVEGFFWDALRKCPNLAFSERIFKELLRCL